MFKTSSLALFLLLSFVLCHDHLFAETKVGEIDLSKARSKETAITFNLGGKVSVQCFFYIYGEGNQRLLANAALKNTASKVMHIAYYAAFFDKEKNLIGCARQIAELESGDETTLAGCNIHVPIADLSKITNYQVVFHESEEPIGKK